MENFSYLRDPVFVIHNERRPKKWVQYRLVDVNERRIHLLQTAIEASPDFQKNGSICFHSDALIETGYSMSVAFDKDIKDVRELELRIWPAAQTKNIRITLPSNLKELQRSLRQFGSYEIRIDRVFVGGCDRTENAAEREAKKKQFIEVIEGYLKRLCLGQVGNTDLIKWANINIHPVQKETKMPTMNNKLYGIVHTPYTNNSQSKQPKQEEKPMHEEPTQATQKFAVTILTIRPSDPTSTERNTLGIQITHQDPNLFTEDRLVFKSSNGFSIISGLGPGLFYDDNHVDTPRLYIRGRSGDLQKHYGMVFHAFLSYQELLDYRNAMIFALKEWKKHDYAFIDLSSEADESIKDESIIHWS